MVQQNKLLLHFLKNNTLQTVLTCFKDIEEYSGCCTCNSFDNQLQI